MVPEGSPALRPSETNVLERIVMAEKPWRGSVVYRKLRFTRTDYAGTGGPTYHTPMEYRGGGVSRSVRECAPESRRYSSMLYRRLQGSRLLCHHSDPLCC